MSACRVIERMPTSVSWILSSLNPPRRRVVAAKAGIAVVAILAKSCGVVVWNDVWERLQEMEWW